MDGRTDGPYLFIPVYLSSPQSPKLLEGRDLGSVHTVSVRVIQSWALGSGINDEPLQLTDGDMKPG